LARSVRRKRPKLTSGLCNISNVAKRDAIAGLSNYLSSGERSPVISTFAQAQPSDLALFLKSTGLTVLRGSRVL
jgi:hypothetical protein